MISVRASLCVGRASLPAVVVDLDQTKAGRDARPTAVNTAGKRGHILHDIILVLSGTRAILVHPQRILVPSPYPRRGSG